MIACKPLMSVQRSKLAVRQAAGRPAARRPLCRASQRDTQPSSSIAPAAPLAAALLNLAAAAPSLAQDAVAIGAPDKPLFALSPSELFLVTTPLIGYAIYNYARTRNAQLGFNDLLLIIAAVFLFGNIISIFVFKTSFY